MRREKASLHCTGLSEAFRVETAELKEQDEQLIEEPGFQPFDHFLTAMAMLSSKYIVTLMAPSGAPSTTTRTRKVAGDEEP